MAFEISDLMIQVVTGAAYAKDDPPTACRGGHSCGPPPDHPTQCRGGHSCEPEETTRCRAGSTCADHPTACRAGNTCMPPGKKSSAEAELDVLLAQLRATLAADAVETVTADAVETVTA